MHRVRRLSLAHPLLLGLSLGCTADTATNPSNLFDGGAVLDVDLDAGLCPDAPASVWVTWTAPEDTTSWIEFGEDESYGSVARPASGADGEALIFGLPGGSEAHFRVVVDDGERLAWSEGQTIWTGVPPAHLPSFEVIRDTGEEWGRFALFGLIFDDADNPTAEDERSALIAINRRGQIVWWYGVGADEIRTANLSEDGRSVLLVWDRGATVHQPGVSRVGFDGIEQQFWPSEHIHHDFVELDERTVAVIEADIREFEGRRITGDRITEIDQDGERNEVWSSWDTMPPESPAEWPDEVDPDAVEWTHANGLSYSSAKDQYLMSMYWLRQVVAVDAATGDQVAVIGGRDSTYAMGEGAEFGPQHAPVHTETGLALFDNGFMAGHPSRVMGIEYREDVAALAWEWSPGDGAQTSMIEGDLRALPGGYMYASFGTLGELAVISPPGEPAWQVRSEERFLVTRGQAF